MRVGGMPSGCKDPADALLMNKGDPSVFLQSAVVGALPWQEWCVRASCIHAMWSHNTKYCSIASRITRSRLL